MIQEQSNDWLIVKVWAELGLDTALNDLKQLNVPKEKTEQLRGMIAVYEELLSLPKNEEQEQADAEAADPVVNY